MTQIGASTVYPIPKGWQLFIANDIKSPEPHSCVAGPFGSKISSKYFVEEGVPVIRGSNLRDDLTRFVPQGFVFVSEARAQEYRPQHTRGGDLVFTCWGTIGQVGLVPEDGPYPEYIISNKQLKLRVDRNIANPLFCFYYFASPHYAEYIRNLGIGGAVPGINLGILKSLPIALPSLTVQRRIASILSSYDDLIENNRRRMTLLEEAARQLYREWFVHLRFPGREHTRITNGVPEGWERKTVAELCKSIDYGYTASAEQDEVGPKFLRIPDIVPDFIDWASVPHCPIEDERMAKFRLCEGDVVIARTGATVGYAKRLHKRHPDAVFASYLVRLRLKPNVDNLMVGLFVESQDYKDYIQSRVGGSAQPNANAQVLAGAEILVPPTTHQRTFRHFVEPLIDQRELLQLQNQKLRAARDLLLPRLMSGEIAV
jgi:type I restriction enzyme S subunit